MSGPVPRIDDDLGAALSSAEEIVEEARNGRMFILVDDEDRENEGDLVIPAERATPEAINFMAMHGRGLICLALDEERVAALGLPLVSSRNASRFETAFTVSIEAREGVTTGISAHDRARTIQVAIDPASTPADLATPGHVFPLAARHGGVLVRAGHTEAAVDIARLAGLSPSGVICEIMKDDGSMARLPDLITFAQRHGMKVGTIADLIAYRRRTEKLVERLVSRPFSSRHGGDFMLHVYRNSLTGTEHVALVKGAVRAERATLVRMHALNVLEDVLGDADGARTGELQAAMRRIAGAEAGVVVLIRDSQPRTLVERVTGTQSGTAELREYGVGAQILADLGVGRMILLSNTQKAIVGLDGYGLTVMSREPIKVES